MVEYRGRAKQKKIETKTDGKREKTKRNTPGYFNEHLSWSQVEKGLSTGKFMQGTARMNPLHKYDAYIVVDGLEVDVLVNGDKDKNRVLHGNACVVCIKPLKEWKPRKNPRQEQDTTGIVPSLDDLSVSDSSQSLWCPKSFDMRSSSPVVKRKASHLPSEMISSLAKKHDLIPVASVVYIMEDGRYEPCIGCLLPNSKVKSNDPIPEMDKFVKFQPNDSRIPTMLIPVAQVPHSFQQNPNAYANHLFLCRLSSWKARCRVPLGAFIRHVGQSGEIAAETEALLLANDIRQIEFNSEVDECLKEFKDWSIPSKEYEIRRDLRSYRIFTVDPATARDLDDALHITKLSDGTFEIGVHIADVSYFVQERTALDKEAASRATTVYLVDRIVPMLPRILCEKLCSLNPDVERLAYSVIWKMNADGTRVESPPWYGRTIIRSRCKLDYGTAQDMIDDKITEQLSPEMSDIANDIRMMNSIAQQRRILRFESGALSLDRTKLKFTLDEAGSPIGMHHYPKRDSNRMIEEYMLLANFLVAEKLAVEMGPKALLRRHPRPIEDGLNRIAKAAEFNGIPLDPTSSHSLHRSLQQIREEFGQDTVDVVQVLLTSPMKVAEYFCVDQSPETFWRHYALSIPYYTHFTSPIRRYADVIVHRLLTAALSGDSVATSTKALTHIAQVCNEKRLKSKSAQEQSDAVFLCVYLRDNPREFVEGLVIGVGAKSFTVYVKEFGLEQRLFLSDLNCTGEFNKEEQVLTIEQTKISFMSLLKLRVSVTDTVPISLSFEIVHSK